MSPPPTIIALCQLNVGAAHSSYGQVAQRGLRVAGAAVVERIAAVVERIAEDVERIAEEAVGTAAVD